MPVCKGCAWPAELDDVAVRLAAGFCVCLRCYRRQVGGELAMPQALRRVLIALAGTWGDGRELEPS